MKKERHSMERMSLLRYNDCVNQSGDSVRRYVNEKENFYDLQCVA